VAAIIGVHGTPYATALKQGMDNFLPSPMMENVEQAPSPAH
jgi:hypothetical protein